MVSRLCGTAGGGAAATSSGSRAKRNRRIPCWVAPVSRPASGVWKLSLAAARSLGFGSLAARNVTLDGAALGDAGGFTGAAAQVIKLGAADVAAAHHLDMVDDRRIEREDALDALAETDLAHREAGADALVRAGDAHPLEILHASAVAFDHLDADAQRVARAEFGDGLVLGERVNGFALERLDQVHFLSAFVSRRCAPEGGACDAPPWRSIRSGRRSRVSSIARSCRHAAIFA